MYIPRTDYTNQSVLASGADNSSRDVVFTNIQWGDYQLIIGCGNNSVCSALSQWIHFPEPVSVPAHPSYSELGATMFGFKKTVADYKAVQDALKADYDNLKEVNKHLQERVYFLSSNLTNMISALRAELHNGECARYLGHFVILNYFSNRGPLSHCTYG